MAISRIYVVKVRWKNLLVLVLLAAFIFIGYTYLAEKIANQAVEAVSWAVANKVIVVDPGHGGVDGGAVGPGGTLEKDINLAIAKKLSLILSQAGAAVVMTRETDTDLSTPGKSLRERKREDLNNRINLAQKRNADLYICIQANSFGRIWTGAQTFYYYKSTEGKKLARAIQSELRRILRNTNRRAQGLDTYILRNLDIPTVVVEVGFISNPQEEKLLNDPTYQSKLSWAIYAGIVKYYASNATER
ncbi:N-acetylmuramoyl-L-alanine amidase CwlD [Calderihabitans maritimus]|uniref:N-acetylmuramoyl-L-alanine amidase CwlD n=1 Tax=Calderihabitans maritimus TaxID=1246530 RepID=A0A1Z5HMX4_9FIRM|nr:N-acetylmuramoyl-L-alanine amidase CwlD [Calderihabitans maritimus]GAW90873.1 N-acetylmuramoyl-L-alanine amidase CwlD [Calderihabitans maritimus]